MFNMRNHICFKLMIENLIQWKFWTGMVGWMGLIFRMLFVNADDESNNVEKTLLCIETAFGSSLLSTGSDAPKDK